MKLDKVIKDLEGMKKAGMLTCNIQYGINLYFWRLIC